LGKHETSSRYRRVLARVQWILVAGFARGRKQAGAFFARDGNSRRALSCGSLAARATGSSHAACMNTTAAAVSRNSYRNSSRQGIPRFARSISSLEARPNAPKRIRVVNSPLWSWTCRARVLTRTFLFSFCSNFLMAIRGEVFSVQLISSHGVRARY
jgi:hypothetical protein